MSLLKLDSEMLHFFGIKERWINSIKEGMKQIIALTFER